MSPVSAKISNRKKDSKNQGTKSGLDCTPFYKGKFIEPGELGEKNIVVRDGTFSYFFPEGKSEYKMKSKIIVLENCMYKLVKLEYKDPNLTEDDLKRVLEFQAIEQIYKIEKNKAFYRGVNCNCEGHYEKIE